MSGEEDVKQAEADAAELAQTNSLSKSDSMKQIKNPNRTPSRTMKPAAGPL